MAVSFLFKYFISLIHFMKMLKDILLSVNCLDDFCCRARLVHGVYMDMADAVFLQIPDLADGVINTGFPHVFGIVTVDSNQVGQPLGYTGAGQRNGCADLFGGGNGHDSCADRNIDSLFFGLFQEGIVKVVVKEKLADEESGAGLLLFFQMV